MATTPKQSERKSAHANDDENPVQSATARVSGAEAGQVKDSSQVEQDVDPNESTAMRDKRLRMEAAQREETVRRGVFGQNVDERGNVLAPYAVEGNDTSAYVGVNHEYMTYANDTEKPLRAEEGSPERFFEDELLQPRKFAVGGPTTSNPTEGGGSSVPLLYPDVSGENYVNEPVLVTDAPEGDEVLDSEQPPSQTKDGATTTVKAKADEF